MPLFHVARGIEDDQVAQGRGGNITWPVEMISGSSYRGAELILRLGETASVSAGTSRDRPGFCDTGPRDVGSAGLPSLEQLPANVALDDAGERIDTGRGGRVYPGCGSTQTRQLIGGGY